jgi:hypothetical protein
MDNYSENLEKIKSLITRNIDNIKAIDNTTFWIVDEKQDNESNQMSVSFSSKNNWLKVSQSQGFQCSVIPVDGNEGVFQGNGLPVKNIKQFIYQWKTEKSIDEKTPGDCDCLIVANDIHFLEFKAEASSETLQQIDNNRNKGEAQLAKSLTSIREQLGDFSAKYICVLVVPDFFSYPKFKANTSRKVRFLRVHKCELKEITTSGKTQYNL